MREYCWPVRMDYRAYSELPYAHSLTGYPFVYFLASFLGFGTTMAVSLSTTIQDLPFDAILYSLFLIVAGLVALLESKRFKRALKKIEKQTQSNSE